MCDAKQMHQDVSVGEKAWPSGAYQDTRPGEMVRGIGLKSDVGAALVIDYSVGVAVDLEDPDRRGGLALGSILPMRLYQVQRIVDLYLEGNSAFNRKD